MTRTLGVRAWATSAAVLVAMTACSGSDADPPPSSGESSSLPSTGSSTPTPSESELASAAAEDVVRRYFTVLDNLRQNPTEPLRPLSSVATSTQLAAQKRLLQRERGEGLRQVGTTAVAQLTVQSVNLKGSNRAVGEVPIVTVDVCWDVSGADLVNKSGKSVVSPDRETTGWTRYTVANYQRSKDSEGDWRIATSQDLRQTPCSAA
ncbi:hypothetical protein [Nocardioides caldifontis]|uniref:hypothetical protein n=1 Tax=Nocardioides caldifontis TaxID=2588938 RepID=UPI0011E061D5|nr:hypothetical protein [Nocardioides caldifontis]